jgi:hypothetical protein
MDDVQIISYLYLLFSLSILSVAFLGSSTPNSVGVLSFLVCAQRPGFTLVFDFYSCAVAQPELVRRSSSSVTERDAVQAQRSV